MPKTHVVSQGENLTRIAKEYGFSSPSSIYEHSVNAGFREVRPNPNLIYPGDEIQIPEKSTKTKVKPTGKFHTLTVKVAKNEEFLIRLQNGLGKNWKKVPAHLEIDGELIEGLTRSNGTVSFILPDTQTQDALLKIYLNEDSEEPSHEVSLKLSHLDPFDTISGVQARCNSLGHPCGTVDGVMGEATRSGVESFQSKYHLQIDGEPGPITQSKLRDAYGC